MAKAIFQENTDSTFRYKRWTDKNFQIKSKNFEVIKISETDSRVVVRVQQAYTGEQLLVEDISEIEVDGNIYNTFEALSTVLTPILFSKGGGSGGGGTGSGGFVFDPKHFN